MLASTATMIIVLLWRSASLVLPSRTPLSKRNGVLRRLGLTGGMISRTRYASSYIISCFLCLLRIP